jgi:hypothetical protein
VPINDPRFETTVDAARQFGPTTFTNSTFCESLEQAMQDAWEEAKRAGVPSGTRLKVTGIWGVGENPFTDFKVSLGIDPNGWN